MFTCIKRFVAVALASCSVLSAHAAPAQVRPMRACMNVKNGSILVRPRCPRGESPLSARSLSTSLQGQTGPAGPKGADGQQGPKGDAGPQGEKGEIGAVGARGEKGDKGPEGAQGPEGVRGETGQQGEQGPMGPEGPQGVRGVSAFDQMPQWTTIRGVVGGDFFSSSATASWSATESLHGIPPALLSNELVVISNNGLVDNDCDGGTCLHSEESAYSNRCAGSADNPTAPPGWLCIYPAAALNAAGLRGTTVPNDIGRHGFMVKWNSRSAGASHFRGVWAYTAP